MLPDSTRGLTNINRAKKVSLCSVSLSLISETFTVCLVKVLFNTSSTVKGS